MSKAMGYLLWCLAMSVKGSQPVSRRKRGTLSRLLYQYLSRRAYSIIIFGALFCNMAVKFSHAWNNQLLGYYFEWILTDIAVLLGIEAGLSFICCRWPKKRVVRVVLVFSAIVCTWSVMNAGMLIRTGTQILPTTLLPLIRDPINSLGLIGVNLIKMPAVAVILLLPSAVALMFLFSVLARPVPPKYNKQRLMKKILISCIAILITTIAHNTLTRKSSPPVAGAGLYYNCQSKAVRSFFSKANKSARIEFKNSTRHIPYSDEMNISVDADSNHLEYNVVIVVLEGVQYRHTSLYDEKNDLTPYMSSLAKQGVSFTNARTPLTHTTKALFAILSGRFPSASQDLVEAVPCDKYYGSLATILRKDLGYRSAFFQSAKGNFESRPSLVHNLGFEKFWARDDLGDPNAFIGYLGSDEFAMLDPISNWIKSDDRPFLLMILCSVTHDPYEVPQWYDEPLRVPVQRYRQTISYTDNFISSLDAVIGRLNLSNKTIFCVIGDHGEAFGEHGLSGHDRIAFDEVLRVPWIMRAPSLDESGIEIATAVSTVDLAPTLLSLLGFDVEDAGFDGIDALSHPRPDRKVYFSGWIRQGPAGFVQNDIKFSYNPITEIVSAYNLHDDPFELIRTEIEEEQAEQIAADITEWKKNTIFTPKQTRTGERVLFENWLTHWNGRISSAKYLLRSGN